jgi:hypothetical protein
VTAVLAATVFVVTYALIATEQVHRVTAALAGAAAMVLIGVVNARSAFFSEETGVDWNVVFLLLGMMSSSASCGRPVCSNTSPSGPSSVPAAGRSGSWPRSSWSPPSPRRCWTT